MKVTVQDTLEDIPPRVGTKYHSMLRVSPALDCTEEAEETKETKDIKETQEIEEPKESEEIDELSPQVWETLGNAFVKRTGDEERDINQRLFTLAREVRGCEELLRKRFSLKILSEIVNRWKSHNVSAVEKDRDYLIEFLDKLELVRFPSGAALFKVFEKAKSQPPIADVKCSDPDFELLARLCRELQIQAGDNPFFLDCRSAGKLLGRPHETIACWLRAMRGSRLGILSLVQQGHRGFAARYRFICSIYPQPKR